MQVIFKDISKGLYKAKVSEIKEGKGIYVVMSTQKSPTVIAENSPTLKFINSSSRDCE